MSSEETGESSDRESAIIDHYGRADLDERILAAFEAAGTDVASLSRADVASFEEFHIRGREATRELARLADIEAGDDVLDVGCGVGGPARTLAAEFDAGVVGIDLVEEYCHTAERFTERVGLSDRVRFRRGDALDLPFEDGSFDVIWLQHVLMNVEEKQRAIAEARRVMRPGGTLAIHEICAGPGGEPHFPVPWAGDPSLNFLASPTRLRELTEAGGFAVREWVDVTDSSLEWFRGVIEAMENRSPDAPPALGLNLLMGETTPTKAKNVVRSLAEDRIDVVEGVFDRTE